MNDFTKEELICLRDNIVVPEEAADKGIVLSAYRKTVMMIENYCDHLDGEAIYTRTSICSKCENPK